MQRQELSSVNRHAIDADLAAELVDQHPAAFVVQDAEGRVVAANTDLDAARVLLAFAPDSAL